MAAPTVTFTDKADRVDQSAIAIQNKVTAADMNELKRVINQQAALINQLRARETHLLTSGSFSGSNYQNSNLIDLTPITDFMVYVNVGTGVLGNGTILNHNDGYTFNSATGTLTMPPGNYMIEIYMAV